MTPPGVEGPAQQRLVDDLLAWDRLRPAVPAGLVDGLRANLEAGLHELGAGLDVAAASTRDGAVLVTATSLSRLVCDGWQRDPLAFAQGTASARGLLTLAAIDRDLADRRADPPAEVAEQVWHEQASRRPGDPASVSHWLNQRPASEAAQLRHDVASLLAAFREVWPLLPADEVVVESRRPIVVDLAGGRVRLSGAPGLVLSSPRHDDRARSLVVDLRTGLPRADQDRMRLRFQALLVTLRDDRPPFRWATFHVPEGRSEIEDLAEDRLQRAADRVLDGVHQAVRLATHPTDQGLTIRGGPWCRWCRRASVCPEAATGGARYHAGVDDRRA